MEAIKHQTSALEELSSRLHANAKQLSYSLQSMGEIQSSTSSLDIDTPGERQKNSRVEDIVPDLRNKVKQDALKLFRLASEPKDYVTNIALNHQYTICLRYLCHFEVFAAVPTKGSISLSNISIITSAPLAQLTSVIRMAATSGLFTILPLERVAHSAASLLLATSLEFNAWATCVTHYQFDASSKLALANERWGRSDEMKHSPFSMAFGTDMTFPEYLGQNPLMARTMGQFLSATQMVDSNNPRHLVSGYDWKALGVGTIVDVNTNTVVPAITLAQAFPLLSFELQVQERAAGSIGALVEAFTPDLRSRFTITTYPPPAPAPGPTTGETPNSVAKETKIFLLRHLLHNLPDPIASRVLAGIASLLKPGDRLLIQDLVLPEPNELDSYVEGMLRMREMIQIEFVNGRTRNEAMWLSLINSAGLGLKMKKMLRPDGSDLSVMEVESESIAPVAG